MTVYIGSDRRKGGERRTPSWRDRWHGGGQPRVERRSGEDRRQEALTGVIVGLTGDQMAELAMLWEARERLLNPRTEEPHANT